MAKKKKDAIDPFEILNSEFGTPSAKSRGQSAHAPSPNVAPAEKSDGKQNTEETARQAAKQNTEKGSRLGRAVKILFTVGLAAALAWIIFMPSGSMRELGKHLTAQLAQTISDSDLKWNFTHAATAKSTATTASGGSTTAPAAATVTATTTALVTTTTATTKATTTAAKSTAVTTTTTTTAPSDKTAVTKKGTDANDGTENANEGYICVYLKSQIVIAYDKDGNFRKAFTCSSGKASTPTRTGTYTIHSKYRWRLMIGNCYTQYASSFSSGYLFHSIPYNRRNAATMSNASYDKLGTPASSGCIRLCFRDSKWIYDNCPIGTRVRVIDEKAPDNTVTEPIIPRIADAAHSGWDPTDTAENNPYRS